MKLYFFRRISAFLTDIVVISYLLIFYYTGLNSPISQYVKLMENKEFDFDFQCLRLFLFILYCTIMESSKLKATIGKIIFGLVVADENGQRIKLLHATIRNLVKIASGAALLIGFFWAFYTPRYQTWHDKIAKTYVILSKRAKNKV